jgi:choline dehydrogenase
MTYNTRTRGFGMAWQALRYATTRKGLLGLPAAPIRAYVRTRPGLDAPDAAISWIPFLVGDNFQLAKDSGVTAIMNILRSESTGSIHVTSRSPQTAPAVRFNFLTGTMPRPPITRWVPARWALIRWRWSTISCGYAAWTGCALPTPRSCRP